MTMQTQNADSRSIPILCVYIIIKTFDANVDVDTKVNVTCERTLKRVLVTLQINFLVSTTSQKEAQTTHSQMCGLRHFAIAIPQC